LRFGESQPSFVRSNSIKPTDAATADVDRPLALAAAETIGQKIG